MNSLCRFFIILLLISFYSNDSYSQYDYCTKVFKVLEYANKNACASSDNFLPQEYCNVFVGKVVKDLFNISDFVSKESSSGYFKANDIADLLLSNLSEKWSIIGTCDNQLNLNRAQDMANSNRCVIAVWKNPDPKSHGHVAIILPGTLKTGWNGMKVPNAANFAQGNSELNFVCDRLSKAFNSNKKNSVFLFVNNNF